MEHFVGAKLTMSGIKDRQFEGIDHTAYGVDDTTGKKPEEAAKGQGIPKGSEYKDTNPAHSNVNDGRKPLGTSDPEGFDQNAYGGNAPNHGQ